MKPLIALLLLAMPCAASGPKYVGTKADPQVYQEFGNVYHDIANPAINIGTASTMTITNLRITHISSGPFTNWTGYTPSFSAGFGTVTPKIFYRRVGDTLYIHGFFACGTVAASVASFTLPSGLAIDSTKVPAANSDIMAGTWFGLNNSGFGSGNFVGGVFADNSATDTLFFSASGNASGQFVKTNASSVCGSSPAGVALQADIPISGWSF